MDETLRKKETAQRGSGYEQPAPAAPDCTLHAEIAMLRAAIHQLSARASVLENLTEQLRVLDGLGRASVRLADLLRAQRALDEEQTAAALSRALDEMNRKRRHGYT